MKPIAYLSYSQFKRRQFVRIRREMADIVLFIDKLSDGPYVRICSAVLVSTTGRDEKCELWPTTPKFIHFGFVENRWVSKFNATAHAGKVSRI